MWLAGNLGKHTFFFWLLLGDKLNTRNLLRKKNMCLDNYRCVLCNTGAEESCFHLFFERPFMLESPLYLMELQHGTLDMMLQARADFGSSNFIELVITVARWYGKLEMVLFFMERVIIYSDWNPSSKNSLGWFASRPSRKIRDALFSWCENFP